MKLIILSLAITIILFLSEIIVAQPSLPGAPSEAPIDGGLGLLAAAGGAYAYKKLKKKRQEEET